MAGRPVSIQAHTPQPRPGEPGRFDIRVLDAHGFEALAAPVPARSRPFVLAVTGPDGPVVRGEDPRIGAADLMALGVATRARPAPRLLRHPARPALLRALVDRLACGAQGLDASVEPRFGWTLAVALESHLGAPALRDALLAACDDAAASLLAVLDAPGEDAGPAPSPPSLRDTLDEALPMLEESWLRPYVSGLLSRTTPAALDLCRRCLAQRLPHLGMGLEPAATHRIGQLELLELLALVAWAGTGEVVEEAIQQQLALRQAVECRQRRPGPEAHAAQRLAPVALVLIGHWLEHDGPELDYGHATLKDNSALEATRENLVQLGFLAAQLRERHPGQPLPAGFDLALSEAVVEVEFRLGTLRSGWLGPTLLSTGGDCNA